MMDTGDGVFERAKINSMMGAEDAIERMKSEHKNHGGVFYVGQNLEINESKFIVLAITKKTMTLKLLPKSA